MNAETTAGTIRPALMLLAILTGVTGILYPLVITGIAKIAFPDAAGGSLIVRDGVSVGSRLIGQNFSDPGYFWSRPSATSPNPYNATASGGSNQGPLNPALTDAVKQRVQALRKADPNNTVAVPIDLVTASASGLDPHISVAAMEYQLPRVARIRGMSVEAVRKLADSHTEGRMLGLLGEPRVNVLELNLDLDATRRKAEPVADTTKAATILTQTAFTRANTPH